MNKLLIIIGVVVIIGLGIGTGIGWSKLHPKVAGTSATQQMIQTANEVGSTDTKTFGDTATGVLQKGGLGNDGTHKLIRDGGPSQTVYLISSVVDLDQFVGKKIQVWGQTIKGQKAAWLMDVGRVKIVQ